MQFILKELNEADPVFVANFREQNKVWTTKATDLDAIGRKLTETNAGYADAAQAHKAITESGEDADQFSERTGRELKNVKSELEEMKTSVEGLKSTFSSMCDFF